METIAYTVSGTTTEVSLGALGVGVSLRLELGTHGESKCILPLAALPPETAPAIPFEAPCVIYTGRTGTGPFSGGTILFQGRRTDNSGQASATSANQELVIEDAWYDLRFITLQAAWANITGFTGTTPTYGTPVTWPDCVLFGASPGGPLQPDGTFGTYSPAPISSHVTTGQSIKEILAYAIYFGGVNLQIGTIDPATYVPFYPVRSMRCADALKVSLRVHPDCTCEIDYTSTPPTFNIRAQSNLTPLTFPYKSTSGAKTHLTSSVRPRPDLQVPRVALYLKEESVISGNPVVTFGTDIYPAVAFALRSFDASLDITGPKIAYTIGALVTAAFDPTNLAWWAQKVPALKPVSAGGQVPNSGTGALAFLDSTINGGSGHLTGIQVVDDTCAAINLTTYGYELLTGTPATWMGVQWIEANVVAFFSYHKNTTAGAASLVDQIGEHMHTCRVKLINTASATFNLRTILATGEIYPGGLARAIYTALQPLQYNFKHVILESPFATMVKPGKHCLNLSGGATAWASMNAMVQAVDMELMFSPGTGNVTAKTTVHCGPVAHLEPGQLVALLNIFTNRDLSKINPTEQTSGMSQSGGSVALGNDSPKENSVPATAVPAVSNHAATDASGGGTTNLVTVDATTGQISKVQTDTGAGTTLITGLIAPEYSAAGAPGPSTLA